jgi:hypothetical protein
MNEDKITLAQFVKGVYLKNRKPNKAPLPTPASVTPADAADH